MVHAYVLFGYNIPQPKTFHPWKRPFTTLVTVAFLSLLPMLLCPCLSFRFWASGCCLTQLDQFNSFVTLQYRGMQCAVKVRDSVDKVETVYI